MKCIKERQQRVKEGCLILAIPGQPGFCQDGMNITEWAVREHLASALRVNER